MKVLAVIPARGGSKGLTKKNLRQLAGRSLLEWTIRASKQSSYVTKTIVSSDSDEILSEAQRLGVESIRRPTDISGDDSRSEDLVLHAISELHQRGEQFDFMVLLQPTSPLRTESHIDEAFDKLHLLKANSLISVAAVDNKILKAFVETGDYIQGISNNDYPFAPRQSLPRTFLSNGAIYIVNISSFLETPSFYLSPSTYYLMTTDESIDIDTESDLIEAEEYLQVKVQ